MKIKRKIKIKGKKLKKRLKNLSMDMFGVVVGGYSDRLSGTYLGR